MAGQNWGQADNLRFDCCFISVDASLPALDLYVNQRVDVMVSTGLLEEVYEIYKSNADYTRGLRQAIGVREFEDFLRYWNSKCQQSSACQEQFKENMCHIMNSSGEDQLILLFREAVEKVKLNTRRLVRRQVSELLHDMNYIPCCRHINSKCVVKKLVGEFLSSRISA